MTTLEPHLYTIRESLDYSINRLREYQHLDHSQKLRSLEPIQAAMDAVRQAIAETKKANKPC